MPRSNRVSEIRAFKFPRWCSTSKGQQAQWQQVLDHHWQFLCRNDPDAVLRTLAEAFEDNEAACAAVGIDGGEVSLVLLVPPVSLAEGHLAATGVAHAQEQ